MKTTPKYVQVSNYLKCRWTECSNRKTQSSRMDTKQDPCVSCLQETYFRSNGAWTESEGMENGAPRKGKSEESWGHAV